MHNDSMDEGAAIRHDSVRVFRAGKTVCLEIEGHSVELLPEMAIDLSEHLRRLVRDISYAA